jgi:hypothetical protein
MAGSVFAQEETASSTLSAKAQTAIEAAEKEVEAARAAIDKGKQLIATIPEDSPLMPDVAQVVQAASDNWKAAVESLQGAKDSAAKIEGASSDSIAADYALLARVNAGVSASGAKVVQIAITYVEAIASNKTESLDVIRTALQDAIASSSQVRFNYDRVKSLIAQKYSK